MEVLRRRSPRSTKTPVKAERHLPPQVPEELAELDEAVKLLGNLVQALQAGGRLRESVQRRLGELIGTVPGLEVARAWKIGLKELRSELTELERRAGAV